MEFDKTTRNQLALSGGIIGGLFAFIAIYNVGAFIANDKLLAYIVALVSSFCVILVGTGIFAHMLETNSETSGTND